MDQPLEIEVEVTICFGDSILNVVPQRCFLFRHNKSSFVYNVRLLKVFWRFWLKLKKIAALRFRFLDLDEKRPCVDL